MKTFMAAGAASLALALAACSNNDAADTTVVSSETDAAVNTVATGSASSTSSSWPTGARIVEEKGVTYRVDPGGARVELGPNDSRIVVEKGVRYRVDPDGSRVRIDTSGAVKIGDSIITTGPAPNGASDVENPGETVKDAAEDAAEAVGDVVTGKKR